jgi:dynein light intermediate chain 1, cytosolic
VREFSIQYGASVLFCSAKVKETRNLETLYKYILHRLYEYDFTGKPEVTEKDSLFIPSGFDSMNLIRESCQLSESV